MNPRWSIAVVFGLPALLLAASLAAQDADPAVPAREMGLVDAPADQVVDPPAEQTADAAPGEKPLIGQDFPQQPTPVPHGVEDFLPITQEDNMCVICHAVEEKVEGEATPIPDSHYTDLRNAPDEVGDEVVGARWNCVACHVAPGGNPPLVENGFRPGG